MNFDKIIQFFRDLISRLHPLETSDWTVVVAGISIVLGTLFVLILVFRAFGAIMQKTQNASNKKKVKKNSLPPSPPITPAPKTESFSAAVPEQGISGEVVAAISAAIYEMEENSNSVITSITPIRKQNPITRRNPWANAAVMDNTRPF